MKQICPNCGNKTNDEPKDIMQCLHCNQISESNTLNQLLSAAWIARKENTSLEMLRKKTKLDEDFLILIYTFICEYNYSHQDFRDFLNKII